MGTDLEFSMEALPFAQFLNLESRLKNPFGLYPNTYPTLDIVTETMQSFGVELNDTIVCYNQRGKHGSGRVYHILTSHGFTQVKVLNGDLEYWKEQGTLHF